MKSQKKSYNTPLLAAGSFISLIRDGSDHISPTVINYLRDCYDHTIQIIDVLETYRELASGLTDVYLSATGNIAEFT